MKKKMTAMLLIVLVMAILAGCGEDGSYVRDRDQLIIDCNPILIGSRANPYMLANVEDYQNNRSTDGTIAVASTKLGEEYVEACRTLLEKQIEYYVEHWDEKNSINDLVLEDELEEYYQACTDIYTEICEKAEEEERNR